jgi:hypothetical protein
VPDNSEHDDGQPLEELKEHTLEAGPDLPGRVRRSINRSTLGADSLEFSVTVMLKTFWEHLVVLIESIPGTKGPDKED